MSYGVPQSLDDLLLKYKDVLVKNRLKLKGNIEL